MRARLWAVNRVVFLAGLALGPVVVGKLFAWQGLLLVGWAAVMLALAGLAAVWPEQAPAPAPAPRLDAVDWALVAFVALQAASAATSVYPFASLLYAGKAVAGAIVFWMARYGLREGRWREGAMWALAAGGAIAAIWGIREYVRTVFFLDQPEWRIFGPFYNPNCLAGYLLVTAFPALALLFGVQSRGAGARPARLPVRPTLLSGRTPRPDRSVGRTERHRHHPDVAPLGENQQRPARRDTRPPSLDGAGQPAARYPEIAAAFAALLMLVALLLTGSKAALAAFLVGAIVFGVLAAGRTRRPWLVRGLAVAGVAAMVLAALALPPIRVRLVSAFGWQSHSMQFRVYTWQGTLDMVRARPWLGHGGGTFENAFPLYAIAGYTRAAHQAFLQLAAECGAPALLAGLVWGALVMWRIGRGAMDKRMGLLPGLAAAAAVAAIVASCLQEMVDYAWYVPAVGMAFAALAGVGVGRRPPPPAPSPGGRERPRVERGGKANGNVTSRSGDRSHPEGTTSRSGDRSHPEGTTSRSGDRSHREASRSGERSYRWTGWLGVGVGGVLLLWALKAGYGEVVGLRGDRLAGQMLYPAAAAAYSRAAQWSPGQARFAVQRAKVLEAMAPPGDQEALARAVRARLEAIRLQPTDAVSYVALARLYEQAGDYASGVRAAEEAVRWYPRYPRGLAQLGNMQRAAGRQAEALATFRRLADLYETPVGQCPAITEMIETAYAYAWIALADEARAGGDEARARRHLARAGALVSRAAEVEGGMQAQLAAAGEGSLGRLEEHRGLARQLLERWAGMKGGESDFRVAQLRVAIGEAAEARKTLEHLSAGQGLDRASDGVRLQAWGTLRLARQLVSEKQEEEGKSLAAKGLSLAREAMSKPVSADARWHADDEAELMGLRVWAERLVGGPEGSARRETVVDG